MRFVRLASGIPLPVCGDLATLEIPGCNAFYSGCSGWDSMIFD